MLIKSERLSIEKFGRILLETEDLDPVYVMLSRARLSGAELSRWLLAYWWFYSSGVASALAVLEGGNFYSFALHRVSGTNAPRGAERRHFRGKAAKDAIRWFRKKYPHPEDAVEELARFAEDNRAPLVMNWIATSWPMFGPWIAFKAADMLERCYGVYIEFLDNDLELYKTPTLGAIELCARKGWEFDELGIAGVIKKLKKEFKAYKAPPDYKRPLNVQEIETILCKWKSHLNGFYPVGKDTREIRHSLQGWGKLARRLQQCLPS